MGLVEGAIFVSGSAPRYVWHFLLEVMGQFKASSSDPDGPGESALLMAEQFALQQGFGKGTAVYGNAGVTTACALVVDYVG